MTAGAPEILVRRGLDRGLAATIVASAALHFGVFVVLLLIPGRLLTTPSKPRSYTVDLVAPDVIGGTNLIAGGGKAKPAAKPVEVAKVAQPAAAPPALEPAAAAIKEPAKPAPEPPKPVAAPVEPAPVAEPPKAPVAAKPAPPEPPVQKPAAPPEPPKAAAVKVPDAKPAPPPKPAAVDAKPAEVKPIAKAEPPKPAVNPQPAKVEAKPAEAKPAEAKPGSVVKPNETTKTQQATEAKPTAASDAAARAAKQRDDQIAAAVQRRGSQVQGEPGAQPSEIDKQIAAAVQRRAQQAGSGSGPGAPGPGGPVSVGPGSGAGGTSAGLEYILYQGRMEQKIKAAWAWAGADRSLRAVIQFNLGPDGQIANVRTMESSGDRQYDASCERAVRAANPLEPVPEKYRKEFASVEMTFKPTDLEP